MQGYNFVRSNMFEMRLVRGKRWVKWLADEINVAEVVQLKLLKAK